MIAQEYTWYKVTDQQHATFEREGWGIFNGNEVEHINDMLTWLEVDTLPKGFKQLKSDKQAVKRARHHGFLVKRTSEDNYQIIGIVTKN